MAKTTAARFQNNIYTCIYIDIFIAWENSNNIIGRGWGMLSSRQDTLLEVWRWWKDSVMARAKCKRIIESFNNENYTMIDIDNPIITVR